MNEQKPELYMLIFSLKELRRNHMTQLLQDKKDTLSKESGLAHFNIYHSLRGDCDLVGWVSANDPTQIEHFLRSMKDLLENKGEIVHSFMSIYQRSPYLKNSLKIEEQILESERKYIIAYPMSKSNEWYLLPYEERKRIMDEHIKVAITDPNNKDILSYTTYSFGIGDQEFVVIYETDSLYSWMKVTEKLREVEARKWIIKETPILTGIRI